MYKKAFVFACFLFIICIHKKRPKEDSFGFDYVCFFFWALDKKDLAVMHGRTERLRGMSRCDARANFFTTEMMDYDA